MPDYDTDSGPTPARSLPFKGREVLDFAKSIGWALVAALAIRAFVLQSFVIPSGSMLHTLLIGDHLFVAKSVYGIRIPFTSSLLLRFRDPKPGEIIVFVSPSEPEKDFIKRVVGAPGDTIEIRDKEVWRNGVKLVEPYVRHTDPRVEKGKRDNLGPFTVPADSYFVMGDNRDESFDSRFWGFVPRVNILGKALFLYWSSMTGEGTRWDRIGKALE